ncbi:MAG: F0F1 ATP synthase subunit alpha [Candidatus Makaraimicrobium thalassicum]|nr:MAG: F0F1 ATP synthase subunit alpha [Candidatus Omnitrophota bacterium]
MKKNKPDHSIHIPKLEVKEVGLVKEAKRGIAKVAGLPSCIYGQLVEFKNGITGMVIGFNPEETLVIILGEESHISVGDSVTTFSEFFSLPVGEQLIGRVVSSTGKPLDDKGDIAASDYYPVFREAPGIIAREPITEPLLTGIKALDLTVPIGKGQRELIIGDRQTGKSSIALDTIINQKGKDIVCIYCWVGGSYSVFESFMHMLSRKNAFPYLVAVCAPAATPAAEQYLAPYTAAAIGEYFMYRGRDVLVVFDDLTKHAWTYRQMSLLLERAPGREAYPGDVFFLHSQLMERAGRLKKELGGGTMTFLPIVETMQGDITGYIQTNLISMTDGQIYLNTSLFQEGFKPAIDLGLSVSRVGSKVQYPAIRELGGGLRLEYAQYREMLRLTRLRTRLSEEAMAHIQRGETLEELFRQDNFNPLSLVEEIVLFYAFSRKILEVLTPTVLKKFKTGILQFLLESEPGLVEEIEEGGELSEDVRRRLDNAFIMYFKKLKQAEVNT